MKVVFFYDKRSVNDATLYYIHLIETSFSNLNVEMVHCTDLIDISKNDIIFTITSKYFCIAKIRFPFNKTIFWAQGVGPEEYLLGGKNYLKYFVKNVMEFISIRFSSVLFFVSKR